MSLRLSKNPPPRSLTGPRRLEVSRLAHNRALHYLASHDLIEDERAQLTEVVLGYIGQCDEEQARAGLDWLRGRYRRRGEVPPF
jgi:hypothetical protein